MMNLLLLFPWWGLWGLILLPKIYSFAVIAVFCTLLCIRERAVIITPDRFTYLFSCHLFIYGISILYNIAMRPHDTERIMAAFNSIGINIMALFLYQIYRNKQVSRKKKETICLINLIVLMILYTFYEAGQSFRLFGHSISGIDYINGNETTRFLGAMRYANLIVFFALLIVPVIIRKRRFMLALLVEAGCMMAIFAAKSRSGLLVFGCFIIITIAHYIYTKRLFTGINRAEGLALVLVVLFAFLLLYREQTFMLIQRLFMMRAGSNAARISIYRKSIVLMISQSPLIGMGIKDLMSGSPYPLGSHSSYIGAFFKAGILGGAFYVSSILELVRDVWKKMTADQNSFISGCSVMLVLLMMLLEDIDGENWLIMLFFISCALLQQREPYRRKRLRGAVPEIQT